MMLTVAYKRLIAHCSSGLSKVIIFAEGFVQSYNYFAVTMLQDKGRGCYTILQYCTGGLRSIYGVQSRVKSREILHDYTGACDDTAIIRGFTRQ